MTGSRTSQASMFFLYSQSKNRFFAALQRAHRLLRFRRALRAPAGAPSVCWAFSRRRFAERREVGVVLLGAPREVLGPVPRAEPESLTTTACSALTVSRNGSFLRSFR